MLFTILITSELVLYVRVQPLIAEGTVYVWSLMCLLGGLPIWDSMQQRSVINSFLASAAHAIAIYAWWCHHLFLYLFRKAGLPPYVKDAYLQ